MKTIGGEIELRKEPYNIYYTDSGRSSLRLILKNLKGKVIALPNYLCSVIVDVFNDEQIEFKYYEIKNDLSIDISSIPQNIDVLYVINYFGLKHDYLKDNSFVDSKIIIEDNVFSPYLENSGSFEKWISYNSYRKFSFCAEGSLFKTNMNLNTRYIKQESAPFVENKYVAKDKKYCFINKGLYSEEEYLNDFEGSESLLDSQIDIFRPSDLGISNIVKFHQSIDWESKIRDRNYSILKDKINPVLGHNLGFKSFFVFKCNKRDELRKELFKNNIFLPIHWPNIGGLNNRLYGELLSIPVDSRYSEEDMVRVASIICNYL